LPRSDADLDGHTFVAFGGQLIDVGDVNNAESGSEMLTGTLSGMVSMDTTLLNDIGDKSLWQGRTARLWFQLYDESGVTPQGAIVQYYTGYMSSARIVAAPDGRDDPALDRELPRLHDAHLEPQLSQSGQLRFRRQERGRYDRRCEWPQKCERRWRRCQWRWRTWLEQPRLSPDREVLMTRHPQWEARLHAFVSKNLTRAHDYETQWDCLFGLAGGAVRALAGKDQARKHRSKYKSHASVYRYPKSVGHESVESYLDSLFDEKPVGFAQRGDLVLCELGLRARRASGLRYVQKAWD
jgi:hypothetical protein